MDKLITYDEQMTIINSWGYTVSNIRELNTNRVSVYWQWKYGPLPYFSKWNSGLVVTKRIMEESMIYDSMADAVEDMYHRVKESIWDTLVIMDRIYD